LNAEKLNVEKLTEGGREGKCQNFTIHTGVACLLFILGGAIGPWSELELITSTPAGRILGSNGLSFCVARWK
jgi:hypothetical protein